MHAVDIGVTVGLVLIGLSACVQIVCLFLTRVLVNLHHGGHISTLKMWLYLAAFFEQMSYIVFHIKYNLLSTDFENATPCIILRFMSSFWASQTSMWLLCISAFYLVLTIKPEKCFTFHARFLSHCTTWTWSCVSCLMYLLVSFLVRGDYHLIVTGRCWNHIANTIHLFCTYGNEFIPHVVIVIINACARMRISKSPHHIGRYVKNSECNVNVHRLVNTINRYLILSSLLVVYYIVILFRLYIDERGSDVILLVSVSSRGLLIALVTCFIDEDVLSLLRGKDYQQPTVCSVTNGRAYAKVNQHLDNNTIVVDDRV